LRRLSAGSGPASGSAGNRSLLVGVRAGPGRRCAAVLCRGAGLAAPHPDPLPRGARGSMTVPTETHIDARILDELRAIVGDNALLSKPEDLRTYECDALTAFKAIPRAVALPSSTAQVQDVVRVCHRERIPFVARGAGTGLSGGALPVAEGIVISLARMNRILEVDLPNARVVVEPGVINLDVTGRVAPQGYFYAPDPSSQSVCSIG